MQGEGFKKLLMKKKAQGKTLSPEAAEKKMEVIQELMESMGDDMGDKVKGLQKVTVAAKSKEGLIEGLEKAGDLLESKEDEEGEEEEESKEDIEAKLSELKEKLNS